MGFSDRLLIVPDAVDLAKAQRVFPTFRVVRVGDTVFGGHFSEVVSAVHPEAWGDGEWFKQVECRMDPGLTVRFIGRARPAGGHPIIQPHAAQNELWASKKETDPC